MKSVSPKLVLGLLIFIVFFHILATVNYWYWTIYWFDILMHFIGGVWLAALFLCFFFPKLQISEHKTFITAILTISFAAFVGILWEFSEFGWDFFVAVNGHSRFAQQGLADTMSDLFLDLLGSLVFFGIYKIFIAKKHNSLEQTAS